MPVNTRLKAKAKKLPEPAVTKAGVVQQPRVQGIVEHSFQVGDFVHHPKFGNGKVESFRDDKLTVKFAHGLIKEIRADFLKPKQ